MPIDIDASVPYFATNSHPPVSADGLVAQSKGLVSEGAVVRPGAAGIEIEIVNGSSEKLEFL